MLALDGVENVSLADDDGRLLSERGDAGAAGLVLGWGRDVRAVSRSRARDLEDLMITSSSAYHLLRRVAVDGAEPAWVYVRVGRAEGNLALTRRRLAMLALHAPAPAVAVDTAVPLPRRRPGALLPPAVRHSGATGGTVASRVPAPLFEPPAHLPQLPVPPVAQLPVAQSPVAQSPVAQSPVPQSPVPQPPLPSPRRPGPAPTPAPEPQTPATGWATDLTVMRRLLAGLRRLV